MSDPISNDYSSVTVLTPEQQYKALLTLARLDDGAAPMEGALGIHDLIDMAGLTDVANQRRHQMGLGPLRAGSPVPPIPRDSYGRARADHGPARAIPDPIPPQPLPELPEGHTWCRCEPVKHILTPETSETTYVDPSNGKRNCKVGRRLREDAAKVARRQGRAKDVKRGRAA